MRRRAFLSLLGGAVVVCPIAARAQQQTMPVIGFLSSGAPDVWAPMLGAFRQGLQEFGYVEGQNVAIEYRWADGQNDRLPELAADLVRRNVTMIAGTTTPGALAAKSATATIPIVFEVGGDPVAFGLVASLNHPSGNLTGVSQLNSDIAPKRLELLHEMLPEASVVALLVNPTNPAIADIEAGKLRAAAHTLGVELHILNASSEAEFETVFATLVEIRAGGLVINTDAFLDSRSKQLAALTARHAVPAIGAWNAFSEAGGLASYGSDLKVSYRLVGEYAGRILKGENPADLPVQLATKIELNINLKAAKALGITVPITLLGRADGVIE